MARWFRVLVALAVLAAVGLVVAWTVAARSQRAPVAAAPVAVEEAEADTPDPEPSASEEAAEEPESAPVPDASIDAGERPRRRSHTANPCLRVEELVVPDGFQVVSAQGITIAWPPAEVQLREPTALAYVVAGLIAEAARFTGTDPRERLTVVVYPTRDALVRAGLPKWADAFYDGAVRLQAAADADFGVSFMELRHELMHAQLHTGVGCTPIWLNEGAAMYFAGVAPRKSWARMLRRHQAIDPASMEVSTVDEIATDDVELVYAESLAMVLFTADASAEAPLARVIEDLDDSRAHAGGLWARRHPVIGRHELIDSVARRMFGMSPGPELDAALSGKVCCYGFVRVSEFGCRAAPADLGKDVWHDESRKPYAICFRD